jgi:hypothetical protein
MTLSSMVVSRDWQEISVLECILGSLHMDVAIESEPQRALTRLSTSKIDALIVDCDLNGTGQFLRELQSVSPRLNTVPLVIMGSAQGRPDMEGTGAMFAFDKPISVEQAVRTLSAARNMILDGRLRYHRAGLELPVTLKGRRQKQIDAQLVNLSQGGHTLRKDGFADATHSASLAGATVFRELKKVPRFLVFFPSIPSRPLCRVAFTARSRHAGWLRLFLRLPNHLQPAPGESLGSRFRAP